MLLNDTSNTASFGIYDILINWGLSKHQATPSLSLDFPSHFDFSNAIHECTHQCGMHTEMGLWYLHSFWKFMAEVCNSKNALPLVKRDEIWNAWWLVTFLLEGQAMYSQLHLIPDPSQEIHYPQYGLVHAFGLSALMIDNSSPQKSIESIQSLFTQACLSCHKEGTKSSLLLATSSEIQPYLMGYLFFRTAQAYLSKFDSRMQHPEVFYVFFSNLVFNNCFRINSNHEIMERTAIAILFDIVNTIKNIGPKTPFLLKSVLNPLDFGNIDYISSDSVQGWVERPHLDKSVREFGEDILNVDENIANIFIETVLSLNFLHLKFLDSRIVGINEECQFLHFLAKDGDGFRIGGMKISVEKQCQIQAIVNSKNGIMINDVSIKTRVRDVIHLLDRFTKCEIQLVLPMKQVNPFRCLCTKEQFILLDDELPTKDLSESEINQLKEKGYSDEVVSEITKGHSNQLDNTIDLFRNSTFIRSLAGRREIISHYLNHLDLIEDRFNNFMQDRNTNLSNVNDPNGKREDAFQNIQGWFSQFIWGSTDSNNPIYDKLFQGDLLADFKSYCGKAPIKDSMYSKIKLAKPLDTLLRPIFSENVLFEELQEIPKAEDVL